MCLRSIVFILFLPFCHRGLLSSPSRQLILYHTFDDLSIGFWKVFQKFFSGVNGSRTHLTSAVCHRVASHLPERALTPYFISVIKSEVMGRLIPQSHSQDRVELSYRLSQIASAPVAYALLITYILYHILCGLSRGFQKLFYFFRLLPYFCDPRAGWVSGLLASWCIYYTILSMICQ